VLVGATEFVRQFAYGAIIVLAVITDAMVQQRLRVLLRARRQRPAPI
jgi:ribose/xylose/arabinose/galactoside ABC-type transport system permease subunit